MFANRYCRKHWLADRAKKILPELASTQPQHPDLLPVQPVRVYWNLPPNMAGEWGVIVPYPSVDGTQPCIDEVEAFDWDDEKEIAAIRICREACRGCSFRVPCREFGIAHSKHGVWGGLTSWERDLVRRARGQAYIELHMVRDYEPPAEREVAS